MPRRRRDYDPVDMRPLINFITAYVERKNEEAQRSGGRFFYADLARASGIQQSVLSELLRRPDREPTGRTLAKLARGMEMPPRELYRIAYPRDKDDPPDERIVGIQLPRRVAELLAHDPFYEEFMTKVERLRPRRRARVLAYLDGLIEADDDRRGLSPQYQSHRPRHRRGRRAAGQ